MRQIADVSDNEFIRHVNPKGEQRGKLPYIVTFVEFRW
jgi:hypothetical protein